MILYDMIYEYTIVECWVDFCLVNYNGLGYGLFTVKSQAALNGDCPTSAEEWPAVATCDS